MVTHPTATFLVDPGICVDVGERAVAELPAVLRAAAKPSAEAFRTLHRLHAVKDRVTVVPTHDPGAAKRLQGSANPSSLVP